MPTKNAQITMRALQRKRTMLEGSHCSRTILGITLWARVSCYFVPSAENDIVRARVLWLASWRRMRGCARRPLRKKGLPNAAAGRGRDTRPDATHDAASRAPESTATRTAKAERGCEGHPFAAERARSAPPHPVRKGRLDPPPQSGDPLHRHVGAPRKDRTRQTALVPTREGGGNEQTCDVCHQSRTPPHARGPAPSPRASLPWVPPC